MLALVDPTTEGGLIVDCSLPIPQINLSFWLNHLLFYILGFFSHVFLQLSSLNPKNAMLELEPIRGEGRQGGNNGEGESGSHLPRG